VSLLYSIFNESNSPWAQRQRSSFQHRQLIRVTTDEVAGTLTITDLGIGMTRSDLINSLVGVGSRLSLRAIQAAKDIDNQCHHELILGTSLQDNDNGGGGGGGDNESNEKNHDLVISTNENEKKHDEDVEDDGRDNDHDDDSQESTCSSSSSSSCSSTTTPWTSEGESNLGKDKDMKNYNSRGIQVPCQAKDIGSFFAAFCAIGTHVEIGTKVSLSVWVFMVELFISFCVIYEYHSIDMYFLLHIDILRVIIIFYIVQV
jgi:hypothetical protein